MATLGDILSGAQAIEAYEPTFRDKARWKMQDIFGDGLFGRRAAGAVAGSETDANAGIGGMGLIDLIPGLGSGVSLEEGKRALDQGRNVDAAMHGAGAALELVPMVGGALKMTGKKAIPEIARALREESGAVGRNRPKRSTELTNLRGMEAKDAVKVARRQEHLIENKDPSEGLYVGGPRDIKTRQDLTTQRRRADRGVEKGARGGDWYDRYRASISEVTDNPRDATWMADIEGQYSAGVSPGAELGFSLRDTNSAIAFGDPIKAARPAQQEASRRAIAANDPGEFQLGKKTGEYARRINPSTVENTATGVNDFRHARTLGYTEVDGSQQRNAIGDAAHRFSDYETALMVDRANRKKLAGRDNWTGEQIQAAPWVAQKANDLLEGTWKTVDGKKTWKAGRRGTWTKDAKRNLRNQGIDAPTPEQLEDEVQRIAFDEANKTIGDFFPKHTAYGTHEAQPYSDAGHLPGLADANPEERLAFFNDPRQGWLDEKGRDSLYAGMRLGDTGYAVRTRPSTEMQGTYMPPSGIEEANPGRAARPLVGIETPDEGPLKGAHTVDPASRALLDAAEATRGYVDVQGATPWHFFSPKAPTRQMNAARAVRDTNRPMTMDELLRARDVGRQFGFEDVVDTGDGVTFANFGIADAPVEIGPSRHKALKPKEARSMEQLLGLKEGDLMRGRQEGGYPGYEDEWAAGVGSGKATAKLFERLDELPRPAREALDANAAIPQRAADRLAHTDQLAGRYGPTRPDVDTALGIIAEGPGWMARLRAAVDRGAVLPAAAALAVQHLLSGPSGSDDPRLAGGNGGT